MTHHLLRGVLVAALAAGSLSVTMSQVGAQAPPRMTPERLKAMAAKPTPKLADGRPDLNGTWDRIGGIEFVRPQTLENRTVCVLGCPGGGPPAASHQPG